MKYFNKEDVEYKNEIESIERKFGEFDGADIRLEQEEFEGHTIFLLHLLYNSMKSSNPNNTNVDVVTNTPYIYPEVGCGTNEQLESNTELLKDLFLEVKDPKTNKKLFQMSYGTSPNSVWITGNTTDTDNLRQFWETNSTANSDYKTSGYDGDIYHYACTNGQTFASKVSEKTNEVYKKYAKLLMGDRDATIKILDEKNQVLDTYDDALFIHVNNNFKLDDLELIFESELECGLFVFLAKNIFSTYNKTNKTTIIKNKKNTLYFNNEKIEMTSDQIEPLTFGGFPSYTKYQYYSIRRKYCECAGVFYDAAPELGSAYRFNYMFSSKDEHKKLKNSIKIGHVIPEHNLIILHPSTNVYKNTGTLEATNLNLSLIYSLITSTTFINGLYLQNINGLEDNLVPGSCHYNDKTFVNIVTTDSDDSYFELLMGFKARLERLYLTEKRQKTIAEYACVAEQQEFNYSNNQSFLGESGNIINVIPPDPDSEDGQIQQSATTYITKIGLYNAQNQLLAVGSLSKPIKKDFNTKRVIKVRLSN